LNSVVTTFTSQPENIPSLLAKRLANHYKFIVAFHGTRWTSATDFIEQGIKLADIDALNLQAEILFGKSDELQKAITELLFCKQYDHGKVFLALTKKAANISRRLRFAFGKIDVLKVRGKPLTVECLIPTNILDSESAFWSGRSFAMLEDYFARLLRPEPR
jgi:hypothetical protein